MSNTMAFILALFGLALLVAMISMLPGKCTGNCEQGRKPCDCDNGKWEK